MYSNLQTYYFIDIANINNKFESYNEFSIKYLYNLNLIGLLLTLLYLKVDVLIIFL